MESTPQQQNPDQKQEQKKEENYFINDSQKNQLRELILSVISVESILEQLNPKLRDLYIERSSEEQYQANLASKDLGLNLFKVAVDKMNNEEKMLFCFFCTENMNYDLKDLLDYTNELYNRLLTVNRKNNDYIIGHSHEIYSFILKQAAEHFYSSKLKVFISDEEDDEEPEENRKMLTEEETREQMEEVLNHPLFMTKAPDKIEGNVHLEALQAIKYDENPQSIAEQNYTQSKESFYKYTKGKRFLDLKESMLSVTNGIDHCLDESEVDITSKIDLLLQRSDLNMFVKNWKHAIDDLNIAMKLVIENPNDVKNSKIKEEQNRINKSKGKVINNLAIGTSDNLALAELNNNLLTYYLEKVFDRFIYCYIQLKNFKRAEELVSVIVQQHKILVNTKELSIEGYNHFLKEFADKKRRDIKDEREKLLKELEQQDSFKQLDLTEKERMFERLVTAGINVKQQYHKIPMHAEANIYIDENNEFHFPVLIVYEEFNMTDYIQDIDCHTTVKDIIEMLFENPLPWDKERLYSKLSLRVFYEMTRKDEGVANYTTTYYYPLKNSDIIFDVLKNKKIIMNGFPVLTIISTNSKFQENFLEKKIILKRKINS